MTTAGNANGGARPLGRWRFALWGGIAGLILLPAVAMQFTDAVAWTASDFAYFAILLVGAGAVFELAAWKIRNTGYRVLFGLAILALVLIVLADEAVGIF